MKGKHLPALKDGEYLSIEETGVPEGGTVVCVTTELAEQGVRGKGLNFVPGAKYTVKRNAKGRLGAEWAPGFFFHFGFGAIWRAAA